MSWQEEIAVLAMWLLWLGYWVASAANSKEVERRESHRSRRWQSVPMIVGGLLVLLPEAGLPGFDARYMPANAVWVDAFGLAAVASGLLFAASARIFLGGNWSVSVTLKAGHELVRGGPYAWVRHPIYSGALLAVLGSALVGGEWRGLIGLGLIAGSLVYKVRLEERWLRERFGADYAQYQRQVAALVPWVY